MWAFKLYTSEGFCNWKKSEIVDILLRLRCSKHRTSESRSWAGSFRRTFTQLIPLSGVAIPARQATEDGHGAVSANVR
jgi:hypothetical protein